MAIKSVDSNTSWARRCKVKYKKKNCEHVRTRTFVYKACFYRILAWMLESLLGTWEISGGPRGKTREGGGALGLLILGKKGEMTEGRKASRASKLTPPPLLPPAEGLDPPLEWVVAKRQTTGVSFHRMCETVMTICLNPLRSIFAILQFISPWKR